MFSFLIATIANIFTVFILDIFMENKINWHSDSFIYLLLTSIFPCGVTARLLVSAISSLVPRSRVLRQSFEDVLKHNFLS